MDRDIEYTPDVPVWSDEQIASTEIPDDAIQEPVGYTDDEPADHTAPEEDVAITAPADSYDEYGTVVDTTGNADRSEQRDAADAGEEPAPKSGDDRGNDEPPDGPPPGEATAEFSDDDENSENSKPRMRDQLRDRASRVGNWILKKTGQPTPDTGTPNTADGPYAQEVMVHDPRTGALIPAKELLDDLHQIVRSRKIVEQDANPRPEPVPLPAKEVPGRAFELVSTLEDTITGWEETSSGTTNEGHIVKTYSKTELGEDGRNTFFTAQLTYDNDQSTVPQYGNLSITEPTRGWRQESYFQASPQARGRDSPPHIYYTEHPYHEESLGQPESNTVFGLQQAWRLISRIPKNK
jgi:hypothetical protein